MLCSFQPVQKHQEKVLNHQVRYSHMMGRPEQCITAVMQLRDCLHDCVAGPLHVLRQASEAARFIFPEPGRIVLAAWLPEVPCI